MLCPRQCGVDRAREAGFCGAGDTPLVARADLHFFEEPCISGTRGSGAVFFSGCNMDCVFCQNAVLKAGRTGKPFTPEALTALYFSLEARGAHNINLVTPAPHLAAIIPSLRMAKREGLKIPVVYNTNAYETVAAIQSLDGLVDIYLPDLKYKSDLLSTRFSNADGYFETAVAAIAEMVRQRGNLALDESGIAASGVLIRHLVLPGCVFDTRDILKEVAARFSPDTYLSLMRQYAPTGNVTKPPLNRKVTNREYENALSFALSCGFSNVYIQDRASADLCYTPAFINSI